MSDDTKNKDQGNCCDNGNASNGCCTKPVGKADGKGACCPKDTKSTCC